MPPIKQPQDLKVLSVNNLIQNIERHWLKFQKGAQITKSFDEPTFDVSKFKYIIGPFEALNDETIDFILKKLYQLNFFNKNYLCMCIHSNVKSLDLSFIRKKSFYNQTICSIIGNNCFNLVELNFSTNNEISPNSLCIILNSMKNLKKLDLSHTKVNRSVTKLLASKCHKLEHVNFENCKFIYDECVEDLLKIPDSKLQYLNIDNVNLSDDVIEKCLVNFKNLKLLYVSQLADRVVKYYQRIYDENENQTIFEQYPLESFYIDSDVNLKAKHMEAMIFSCPNLKYLRINCLGQNECLSFLDGFNFLNDLTISNSTIISFKFGGFFLESLKHSLGKRLKNLTLINLNDVNLRSIQKHCSNLVKLTIEFLDYYEPCEDYDLSDNENYELKNIRYVWVSNQSSKHDKIHLNIGQFRKDLIQIMSNGLVKFLHLGFLNELDEEFFQCLFSKHAPISSGFKFIHESIETMELKEMNNIGSNLIQEYLLDGTQNRLKQLVLSDCKLISKIDSSKMKLHVKQNNFDCTIIWS